MGVVFEARQAVPGRAVAVKVIRSAEFASEGERQRFRNEAEAVARLDHPNIVPVYEFGRAGGLHFFSMKLVRGGSLDRRLGDFADDPRAAARLTATVARAVHHAHQRAVLHRDLKPANVLLDERGQPYVTDFGLARRLDAGGDLTLSGAVVGTPSYMSPEQAEGSRGALTTAADVYGLGAVLYALLTGRAPHVGGSLASTLDLVRNARPEPLTGLNRRVPRDLNVICMKCLEKDPSRRYASALDLADDLDRWLDGRPVAARPVSAPARAAMWCRRHPLPAALAALCLAAVVAGFSGVAWQWRVAASNWARSEAVKGALLRALAEGSAADPDGPGLTVRKMLDLAAYRVAGDFQDRPDVEAAVRETVAGAYDALGEYGRALPHRRAALKLDAAVYGPAHPATLRAGNGLAGTLAASGQTAEAERLLRRNLATTTRLLGPDDAATLEAAEILGGLLRATARPGEAEGLLRRTLDARRRLLPEHDPQTLRVVRQLCLLLVDLGRFEEAEPLALEYEHGVRCTLGPKHPDNVEALANRGLIRELRGKPAEAELFYRRAAHEARRLLGPAHPRTRAAEARLARIEEGTP
jgi:tetratricopeptide (TPR) repeat protein